MRRLLDVIISLAVLLLLFPLFAVIAAAIKLDSKGSVFFVQKRCGLGGRIFRMYKFRSMVVNAEELKLGLLDKNEVNGPMFKIKKDPRVTRVGRVIRKTSLDELPQLFNVLKGDMSLVGPRPPLPEEVRRYESCHMLRLSVKPGITGLWQVSARNTVGFEEMVSLDLRYIRERSFYNDLVILIKTIPLLFGDKRV